MAISARLELRQSQQLVMTPQLQQAIRLLQLSNMELTAFVETELERNPLLEREESDEPIVAPSEPVAARENADNAGVVELDLSRPSAEADSAIDADYESLAPDVSRADAPYEGAAGSQDLGSWSSVGARSGSFEDDDGNLEAFAANVRSLKDHLVEQMHLLLTDAVERLIGQHLVDMVDEAGYLQADLDEVADKLGAPRALIERVLVRLQQCEPVGVFARSLAECLALQLREQNRYDPQIATLLDHLPLLAQRNLPALRKAVGVDMEELGDMIAELKRLNPQPGLKLGSAPMQPVVPDVLVRAARDGSWHVELNSETLPRVLVNRGYYTTVSKTSRNDQDKGYLLDCLQSANWLVKSLDQRARTILRVAEQIVRQQDGFLTHGVQHLRPLNLKTIADAIQLHESTVSRVTSNKHIATPRGIFELKYFFTSAIATADGGEAHSSESVRYRIKQLIEAETAKCVLSDDKLVEQLKNEGVDIARRTVAKYREALKIPSSVQRRREKRFEMHAGGG